MDPKALALAKAIRQAETGSSSKPYEAKGASGESGAYQFMPETWKGWSKQYLGVENAPLTVENQNKVAYSRIKELKDQGYKPAEIASMWNSGRADAYKEGKVGVNKYGASYDVPAYVAKVSQYYKQIVPQVAQPKGPVSTQPFKYDVPETPEARQSKIARYQEEAKTSQAEADKYKGLGFLKEAGKEALGMVLPGPTGFIKTLGKISEDPSQYDASIQDLSNKNVSIIKSIRDMESRGLDTTSLKQQYNENQNRLNALNEKVGTYNRELPTNKQVIGQIGGTVLDVATLGAAKPLTTGLTQSAKFLSKPTAKAIATGAGLGYGYDVSQGLMDKEQNPYTPGIGTALGAGGAILGRASVAKARPLESKLDDVISKREKEIFDIETQYAKTRKANEYSKDAGSASRRRIASTDVLVGAVDDSGKINTKKKGGAIDQYKAQTIDGAEQIVRQDLEREGSKVSLATVEKKLNEAIEKANLPAKEKDLAFTKVQKEIKALQRNMDSDGFIPLVSLQDEKIANYALINFRTPAEKAAYRKAIAKAYKEVIEETSNLNIKEVNNILGEYLNDIQKLADLHGSTVKGGKLGKYFAQVSGNIVGGAIGSVGGPAGSAMGTVIGGELASRIKGALMSKTFGKTTGMTAKQAPVLSEAIKRAKSPRLALPAQTTPFKTVQTSGKTIPLGAPKRKVGAPVINRSDTQLKELGNTKTIYNKPSTTTKNAIPQTIQPSTKKANLPVSKSVKHSSLGTIEKIDGEFDQTTGKGFGLQKIQETHPEVLPFIDELLPTAKVVDELPQMKILENVTSDGRKIRFIVDEQLYDKPKTFLNNAYFVLGEGLEPTAYGASNRRSTIELSKQRTSVPNQNRTDILSLERSGSNPLTYGDNKSIQQNTNKANLPVEKPKFDRTRQGGYVAIGKKVVKEIPETTKAELYDAIKFLKGEKSSITENTWTKLARKFEINEDQPLNAVIKRIETILDKTKTKTVLPK